MFGCLRKVVKLLSVCVWLLTLSGTTAGHENGSGVKVYVKQDSDAVLPCLISTKENITKKTFDWRKDGQKEVFLYDAGYYYNNGRTGQDAQFKARVSHFQDQLMNGNASIKIKNTKMADSGSYSCIFPHLQPRQTYNIELVVERIFKDRSGEIIGTCPKPQLKILNDRKYGLLLQCEVRGASPEPKVELQDSSGNILPAEEPQVLESGGSYNVTLNYTVTKADYYTCVATQEELNHQIDAETYVPVSVQRYEDPSTKVVVGWLGGFISGAVVLAAVQALLVATKRITVTCNRGPRHLGAEYKPPADTGSNSPA